MPEVLLLVEELAKPFESCSLSAYWDCAGYPTNGWGNLLLRKTKAVIMKETGFTSEQVEAWLHETFPDISQDEADEKLVININKAFSSVKRLVKIPLSSEQLAALTDFAFNVGAGKLQISTLLKLINREELISASEEFIRWNKAGGIVRRGLTRRRIAETKLFTSGMK